MNTVVVVSTAIPLTILLICAFLIIAYGCPHSSIQNILQRLLCLSRHPVDERPLPSPAVQGTMQPQPGYWFLSGIFIRFDSRRWFNSTGTTSFVPSTIYNWIYDLRTPRTWRAIPLISLCHNGTVLFLSVEFWPTCSYYSFTEMLVNTLDLVDCPQWNTVASWA